MIYYYIPDFFWHYNVNLKLLELILSEPEMFYDDFKIGAVFGNFPNCIWNGGGYIFGRHIDMNEMRYVSNQFNSFQVPLRLTMTNPIIVDTDVYNRYANYIMKNLNNGFNQVLVSSPILEDYIRENYPEYKIIRSILASEEIYYDDSDKYYMSVLRKHKNNDFKFLESIKHKEKIELLVNETCYEDCPRKYEHYLEYGKLQLHQDNNCYFPNVDCSYKTKFRRRRFYESELCITREKIKKIYEPMGFKHFKISGRSSHGGIILDYAHFMVKQEYKEDFIHMMMNSIVADNR